MKRRVYAIWDAASESYSDPFTCPTDAVAVRQFKQYLITLPSKFRSHFDVVYICEFDPINGCMIDCFENKLLMNGGEFTDEV